MGVVDTSKKPIAVAEIGQTVEDAFEKLAKSLPFPIGHEAYATFNRAQKRLPHPLGYLVAVAYCLRPGYEEKIARTGTGSYRTEMERRFDSVQL